MAHQPLTPEGEATVTSEIVLGLSVYSRDGEPLGTIKEISGTKFRIHAKPDFWLGQDFVQSVTQDRVTIILPSDRVEEFKEKK